ncbi:hypothetical protein M4D51_02715 [Microbacterium sp. p3-SID338]|uniref:hypothetical protein n=1 Tax=unclassified Microbacterium TaxID=2609290 RepID=UPI000C805CB8|nr:MULTISPECIES: hypothetical protein [unclassified Microbacterium]MCT1394631.1 hypothetical protein [Microbacterium sp. p3-SID338]PMC04918.1 hypothetical protein CJ226_04730 [Microbacterium sp. UMB0228]
MGRITAADPRALSGVGVAIGLAVVVVAFLLAGVPAAGGALAVVGGIALVRRSSRAQRSKEGEPTFLFVLLAQGGRSAPGLLLRLPSGGGDAGRLRAGGWRVLEPPVNGPLTPLGRVAVEFDGDDRLRVRDLAGVRGAHTEAARGNAVPHGWGAAAQELGYVVLLAVPEGEEYPLRHDGTVRAPTLGAYALLRGTPSGRLRA